MIPYSLLYPITNTRRSAVRLDGLWRFQFDPESKGMGEVAGAWFAGQYFHGSSW